MPGSQLVIRKEQFDALSAARAADFENRMEQHVKQYFPSECDAIGAEKVRQAVHYGLEQAQKYDCGTEKAICKYLNVMFAFGKDFDREPWAAEVLTKSDPTTLDFRIDRLLKECDKHASEADGIHKKPWGD